MNLHPRLTPTRVIPRSPELALLPACALVLLSAGCKNLSGSLEGPLPTGVANKEVGLASPDSNVWMSWRGGQSHGVSDCLDLPLIFSSNRHVLWKTALPGTGNSSPIVSKEHVYLTSVVGEGHRSQLRVIALDRTTGDVVWEHDLGRPVGSTHQTNGHASATTATDGRNVYVSFGAKGLFCLASTGERRWHRPFSEHTHEWGTASSPILADDTVVQLVDSQHGSFLAAFDKEDGSVRWKTKRRSNG